MERMKGRDADSLSFWISKYLPHFSCFYLLKVKSLSAAKKPLTTTRQLCPKINVIDVWVGTDKSLCCVKSHISSQNINKGTVWQNSIVFISNLRNMVNFRKYLKGVCVLNLMSSLQQKNHSFITNFKIYQRVQRFLTISETEYYLSTKLFN